MYVRIIDSFRLLRANVLLVDFIPTILVFVFLLSTFPMSPIHFEGSVQDTLRLRPRCCPGGAKCPPSNMLKGTWVASTLGCPFCSAQLLAQLAEGLPSWYRKPHALLLVYGRVRQGRQAWRAAPGQWGS